MEGGTEVGLGSRAWHVETPHTGRHFASGFPASTNRAACSRERRVRVRCVSLRAWQGACSIRHREAADVVAPAPGAQSTQSSLLVLLFAAVYSPKRGRTQPEEQRLWGTAPNSVGHAASQRLHKLDARKSKVSRRTLSCCRLSPGTTAAPSIQRSNLPRQHIIGNRTQQSANNPPTLARGLAKSRSRHRDIRLCWAGLVRFEISTVSCERVVHVN
ncbi:hypothetical protein P154DRAFT_536183 [Amniculicola lignicola CBS 123094]|uniref:Uncharacterized protein n=1 Tax=Amniculicola lignicola CBS 123094 TaxID=1392246 RepID=A0A6A5WLW8_9PLEO|nr:hypothetical protein P154DRAFT_536183 [Amniculicola lignicola CBS 123094]